MKEHALSDKTILFIGRNYNNPSVRLRHYDYFPLWRESGYNPVLITLDNNPLKSLKLLYLVRHSVIVIIIRKTLKLPTLLLIRALAKKIVFDFDDAIFTNSNGKANKRRYKRFVSMMQNADMVWAGNNYLKSEAQQYIGSDKITIIPTALDYKKYNINNIKINNYFDLVWIGSTSTKKYLEPVLPILAVIAIKIPNLRLKIISDFSINYPGLNIINIPWSLSDEAQNLTSSHVGIAPMIDDLWTRGKCAFKIIQYLASGLPVLSSPVGMNKELVINGENGYLVTTEDDWANAINILYHNNDLRSKMAVNARNVIIANFDKLNNYQRMLHDCRILGDM